MGAVETVLALVGLVTVILGAGRWQMGRIAAAAPPVEEDVAAPYREGLHAAVRMQRVAQDLEAQIYAEAAKQRRHPAGDTGVSHA